MNQMVQSINITIHRSAIKIKPVDVKSKTFIYSRKENNDKDPKFEIVDIFKISK